MDASVKLPIGIESFEKIRRGGFYYIDKTGLIKELLNNWGEVNLFLRPRRFGKSLNMSMLKYFFEYGCDSQLFDRLEIADDRALCEEYMGKFPVISITLKGVNGRTYEAAREMLCFAIANEALRFPFLAESDKLSKQEKAQYRQLINVDTGARQGFLMSDAVLANSLHTLCSLLHKHYSQKVILLIDEYDVPLDKAHQAGYYDEMTDLIRNLFGQALKTNNSLEFSVLTGCLRISKESIFTGLNNFKVLSITSTQFDEYFGFSDAEVQKMLAYYGLEGHYEAIRTWYDGYRFGNADIYCPWDVINYCAELRTNPKAFPRAYWVNSSGNDILKNFLQSAKSGTRRELEQLMDGGTVTKKIHQELIYRDLYENTENLWSVLFTTGYLTQRGEVDWNTYQLAIPNLEVRQIFADQIMEWFQGEARKDKARLDSFCDAFLKGDAETAEALFNDYLRKTISIRDTSVRRNRKENFYHGILLGLLSHREDWYIRSNEESGEGYSDILIEIEDEAVGIVIEVKYVDTHRKLPGSKMPSDNGGLEKSCREALAQIEAVGYCDRLRQDGMETVLRYGVACSGKRCAVRGI